MSAEFALMLPPWTLEEEIILVNAREATETAVTYPKIHEQIPRRTVNACAVHYGDLRRRELTGYQRFRIQELWPTYREEVFGQSARSCGVTICEFERVVHCIKLLGKPILQDVEDLDCDLIEEHYERFQRKMWRVIASLVPGVSWKQVESSWLRSEGKFAEPAN
ncbi:hypothetical protein Q9L58_008914 [Maublancomyces gigas]|uniref:Uncharacterized protein n=1 Tax=Discina gigas TaxID=1032678 RepID=A0ABR3G8C1_9PEZI